MSLTEEHRQVLRELAEVIRIGSKDTKQCFNAVFLRVNGTKDGLVRHVPVGRSAHEQQLTEVPAQACTLGAAMWALCGLETWEAWKSYMPALQLQVSNPQDNGMRDIKSQIIVLNDSYKWPRERIADWLETL